VVVALSVLLAALVSLSAVSTALAFTVARPGTVARQTKSMVRTSAPSAPSVPRLQSIWVALVATQFWLAGEAEMKLAPLGTLKRTRVLMAASSALLSIRSE
jgi:hypothetical protein